MFCGRLRLTAAPTVIVIHSAIKTGSIQTLKRVNVGLRII
jgi:hypothetical protein